jgi:hypothetical protein
MPQDTNAELAKALRDAVKSGGIRYSKRIYTGLSDNERAGLIEVPCYCITGDRPSITCGMCEGGGVAFMGSASLTVASLFRSQRH